MLDTIPIIPAGTTPGEITLRCTKKNIFVVVMEAGPRSKKENRWTLEFSRAMHKAFDAVEKELEDLKGAPAALLTVSSSPKFFSNGIDPAWIVSPKTPKSELYEWNAITMPSFARPILLPIPTICAIGGHAFGAGMMHALAHDYRIQRKEKGFLCAPEVAIGIPIPPPEMTLFKHDMPPNAFHETVLLSRRWGAEDALRAGIIHQVSPGETLLVDAIKYAEGVAKLAKARNVFSGMKLATKGQVAREIIEFTFPGGQGRKGYSACNMEVLPGGLKQYIAKYTIPKAVKGASKL